ncbi:MAG: hypothetical protein IPI96_14840 [Saprospiraceae bacterium]|nr:hypothetical protein [Saprospiraceae bacterium]
MERKLTRELDLIDVWFDSGSMPMLKSIILFLINLSDGLFPGFYCRRR